MFILLTNCDNDNQQSLVNLDHVLRMDHVPLDQHCTRTMVKYTNGTSHFVRETLEEIHCALTAGRMHITK